MDFFPRWLKWRLGTAVLLSANRWHLFLLLLTLNALARPYAGVIRDARLYGVQSLNRATGGSFGGDLFLRYGSQDQYTIFSVVVSPFLNILGLHWSFFLFYLIAKAVLIYGLLRFVEALFDDRRLSTLSLLFLVVAPLPFGGMDTFHVNETFLTPRLIAEGLVLLSLAYLVQGRQSLSGLFLIGALLFHPIMALGGVAVFLIWQGWTKLRRTTFMIFSTGVGVLLLSAVAYQPFAQELFGSMDAEWQESVRVIAPYNYPLWWHGKDWYQTIAALLVTLAGGSFLFGPEGRRRDLLMIIGGVGIAGLFLSIVASAYGYTRLFQAQPYRALWMLKVLEAPMTLLLVGRLGQSPGETPRLLAVLALGNLLLTSYLLAELMLPVLMLPFAVLLIRGSRIKPRQERWISEVALGSLASGMIAWALFRVGWYLNTGGAPRDLAEPVYTAATLLNQIGPGVWLLAILAAAPLLTRAGLTSWMRPTRLAAGYAASQMMAFLLPLSACIPRNHDYFRDNDFLLRYFAREQAAHHFVSRPTVYWPVRHAVTLWFRLGVQSYFDRVQIAGALFNRGTAVEGLRRARLTAAFEVDGLRREGEPMAQWEELNLADLYQADLRRHIPVSMENLETICGEELLDYVILRYSILGTDAASNGRVYVYDCRHIRSMLENQPILAAS